MKKILLATATLITLAACSGETTMVCDRDAQLWDKFGTPIDVCERVRPQWSGVVVQEDNDSPDLPTPEPTEPMCKIHPKEDEPEEPDTTCG